MAGKTAYERVSAAASMCDLYGEDLVEAEHVACLRAFAEYGLRADIRDGALTVWSACRRELLRRLREHEAWRKERGSDE